MKKILILVAISLIVSSCAQATPSENQIQTAIAETNSSIPTLKVTSTLIDTDTPIPSPTSTNTPVPTNTPTKTAIPKPSATINATATIEAARQDFVELTTNFLEHGEGLEDIKQVNLVRLNDDGVFEIEVKSIWASKDRQPDLSYVIISYLLIFRYPESRVGADGNGSCMMSQICC